MDIAWRPTERYLARSRLRRFAEEYGHGDFASLYRWSVEDLDGFWRAVDRDLGLVWRSPYERVLDSSRGIPWTTWWIGGRMNYVATALRHDPSRTALVFEGEEGTTRRLTYGELAAAVRRFAAGLRALGVRPGDRVGIFLPMIPECAIATLAVSAIGAVYTPIFSGYAAEAIAGRLRDCEVRMRARDRWWEDVVAGGSGADDTFADVSAEDPYMIIYTSGTTGRPKGAVHVHGGFPVKAAQDLAHRSEER